MARVNVLFGSTNVTDANIQSSHVTSQVCFFRKYLFQSAAIIALIAFNHAAQAQLLFSNRSNPTAAELADPVSVTIQEDNSTLQAVWVSIPNGFGANTPVFIVNGGNLGQANHAVFVVDGPTASATLGGSGFGGMVTVTNASSGGGGSAVAADDGGQLTVYNTTAVRENASAFGGAAFYTFCQGAGPCSAQIYFGAGNTARMGASHWGVLAGIGATQNIGQGGALGQLPVFEGGAGARLVGASMGGILNVAPSTVLQNSLNNNGVIGVYSSAGGISNLGSGVVITLGDGVTSGEVGVAASSWLSNFGRSQVNADSVSITLNGPDSVGASARGGALVNLTNGGTINASGNGSVGGEARGISTQTHVPLGVSSLQIQDTIITVTGDQAVGLRMLDGGNLSMMGGTVSAEGTNTTGLYSSNNDTTYTNIASLENMQLSSTGGASIHVDGGAAEINLTNVEMTRNNGIWLETDASDTDNASHLKLYAIKSLVTGAAFTDATSTADVELTEQTRWTMTGSSNLTNLTNDASYITYTAPTGDVTSLASYKTLTTNNYIGANNASIALNTYLGSDASPSDRLVINSGTATGVTALTIRNTGGPGEVTISDGILIVQAINGATTDAGSFVLAGDYVTDDGQAAIIGGAYAYTLHHNGVVNPNDSNWYLRTTVDPVPPVDPEPPMPRYQPGTPVYEAYPQVLLSLNTVPTLQQRVGNRYWNETPTTPNPIFCKDPEKKFRCSPTTEQNSVYLDGNAKFTVDGRGVWARIDGTTAHHQPHFSTSSLKYDADTFKFQGGVETKLYEGNSGLLIGGITTHYGHVTASIDSFFGDGKITSDGYGFGGTLTWYGANGYYVDGQAQVTWYDSDLRSDVTAISKLASDNHGFGYVTSLEGGKRIQVSADWSVTPQAQLIYSAVDFDDFTDPFEAQVSLDRGESLQGRIGVSLDRQKSWKDANGNIARNHLYGIANLYHEFLNGTRVDVSGTKFDNRNNRVWGGVGVGGSYNWNNDIYSVFGEGSANTSLEDFADSYTFKGNIGFRARF